MPFASLGPLMAEPRTPEEWCHPVTALCGDPVDVADSRVPVTRTGSYCPNFSRAVPAVVRLGDFALDGASTAIPSDLHWPTWLRNDRNGSHAACQREHASERLGVALDVILREVDPPPLEILPG